MLAIGLSKRGHRLGEVSSGTRHILLALTGLVVSLVWFELTPTDLWIQNALFDSADQQWIWSAAEPFKRLVFYDGPKRLLILLAASLALSLVFTRYSRVVRTYRRGIRIVVVSLLLVPTCVAGLKATTNIACPRALTQFSGVVPYAGIFGRYPENNLPIARQRCFPASHASSGFALLSLCFLFRSAHNRAIAVGLGLAAGWTMGGYKILIGDHFLSHTVVSMLLAWLVVNVVAVTEVWLFREVTL